VPEAVLDGYVGTYRVVPNFEIAVTHENGTLYAQATGQPRLTLRAESETRFAVQEVPAAVEFQVEDGTVTGLLLLQGGQVTLAPRLP
jgi:serine-type D-Ala-D-Ala carboxypeptidase/endopeptidase